MSVISGSGITGAIARLVRLPRAIRRDIVRAFDLRAKLELYFRLRFDWSLWARIAQLSPAGPWRYWILPGGRGSGKTRSAAEQVCRWASEGAVRIALVGRDAGTTRKVMVDGESGILAVSPPWFRPKYYPSLKRLVWPNGAVAELHTSIEPDTLRGPQYHYAWAEELFHWRIKPGEEAPRAWQEGLRYGLRLGNNPQCVITSTPRPTEFCYSMLLGPKDEWGARPIKQCAKGDPAAHPIDRYPRQWQHVTEIDVEDLGRMQIVTHVVRESTEANRGNLAPGKPEEWRKEWGASRLGQQELDGAILTRAEGALFSTAVIDDNSVEAVPCALQKVVVALDPTRAQSPTDEAGIIVLGLGIDGHVYVLADFSGRYNPARMVERTLEAYRLFSASCVVREINRMPEATLRSMAAVDRSVRWQDVTATENKQTRAEPVSVEYHRGRVHHVRPRADSDADRTAYLSPFAVLEDEMIAWDPKAGLPSPNRMDALVWGVTALLLGEENQRPDLVAR